MSPKLTPGNSIFWSHILTSCFIIMIYYHDMKSSFLLYVKKIKLFLYTYLKYVYFNFRKKVVIKLKFYL